MESEEDAIMNNDELNDLLADYLGGELDEQQRATVEQRLAGDPALAQEVASLRGALDALRALDEPSATPAALAEVPAATGHRPAAVLRYAAAILIAFAIGYVVRDRRPGAPVEPPLAGASGGSTTAVVNGGWRQDAAEAYVRYSREPGLARSLMALAHAQR
jgi:anti-sigma factor RsiW